MEKKNIGSQYFKLCFLFAQVDVLSSNVKVILTVLHAKARS